MKRQLAYPGLSALGVSLLTVNALRTWEQEENINFAS